MNKELKLCPFCRGRAYRHISRFETTFHVQCACGAIVECGGNEEHSVDVWNHRPLEDELKARVVELEIYISKLVYELTDGKLSKPYDVQVVADEVSQIWQEYTDTKVAEAREEEAARQAVEMEQIDFEEVH